MLRGVSRCLLLFAVSLLFSTFQSHAQSGTWAVSAGSPVQDYPEDVLVDDQGNAYITGFFRDTLSFGAQSLASAGQSDIFIAKYDQDGDVVWLKRMGWFENDFGQALAFDTNGDIVFVGEYQDSTILEADTLFSLDTLWYGPYAGTYDVLVITLDDTTGNIIDYKADGWFGSEYFYDVAVDSRNHKVFAGLFRTFNFFGGGLWGRGYDDAFLVTMDTAYEFKWKAVASGRYIDKATSVAVVGDSIWVMAGTFQDTCYFRDSTITEVTNFEDDVFVSCWDSSKTYRWHLRGGGPGKDYLDALEANSLGELYICGRFDTSFTIGPYTLQSRGGLDGYLAKISPSGSVMWVKNIGGQWFDSAIDLEIGDDDRVLLTGYFQGEADFDGTTVSASDSLDQDIFVAAYLGDGSLVWVRRAGGTSVDKGTAIDVDATGNVTVTGVFSGNAWFGSKKLTSTGSEDIFVVRMLPDGSVAQDEASSPALPGISVWPNPAQDILNINLDAERADKASIRVIDLQGRPVMTLAEAMRLRVGTNHGSFSTAALSPGMYFLEVRTGAIHGTTRFVVAR